MSAVITATQRGLREDGAVLEGHPRGDGPAFEMQDVPIVVAHAFVVALFGDEVGGDCGGRHWGWGIICRVGWFCGS